MRDARAATREEMLLAHTADWVGRAERGELTRDEERALGLPWSPALVERARRSVGATLEAADAALDDGAGANLGGGTHHAFPGVGRGFCVFNDVVAATRALRDRGTLRRVLVVDLDVHQGDGTHAALARDDEAFTFSLNGLGNYPFRRVAGDLERDLPTGRATTPTWTRSRRCCPRRSRARGPSCASTSRAPTRSRAIASDGWRSRTRASRAATGSCARRCCAPGIPVCVTLAGGYAERIEDTVAINLATLRAFA